MQAIHTPTEAKKMAEVTEKHLVKLLAGYALERRAALKAYPNANGVDEKQKAIDEILATLDQTRDKMPRATCVLMLRTSLSFGFIAPRATRKLYETYAAKIEAIMAACRQYIGYQKQF